MRTSDFEYELPEDCIAQRPLRPRDASRLMVVDRLRDRISDDRFYNLPHYLRTDDIVVINRTRVLPARLTVRKLPGGGRGELLLLEQLSTHKWRAMVGGKGVHVGRQLQVHPGLTAEIVDDLGGPVRVVRFEEPIDSWLDELGSMPTPPYITAPLEAAEEYQTVFARDPGSVAAPTAGLHFTPELLDRIRSQGVQVVDVTLHIGLDTFAPVRVTDPCEHPIHREWCQLRDETARLINESGARGGRVIAVGTTCVRTLETAARSGESGARVAPFEGSTDLFILPGFQFQAVDGLITNFHLPRSTLLMLVSAFASRERILTAYQQAIERGYRFYSFGDAMLIL